MGGLAVVVLEIMTAKDTQSSVRIQNDRIINILLKIYVINIRVLFTKNHINDLNYLPSAMKQPETMASTANAV
jgi:hypothetical protein